MQKYFVRRMRKRGDNKGWFLTSSFFFNMSKETRFVYPVSLLIHEININA